MRSRFIAPPLAALAALALAAVAFAGGWAQVSATGGPIEPVAGEETTINFEVLQHGETAVSWPALTVVANDGTSGDEIRVEAVARGPEGAYEATLVFPTEGEWTLAFESTDLVMDGSVSVSVAPAAVPVAPVASAATAATAFDVSPLLLVLGLVGGAVAIGGALLIAGRRSTTTRVSVGN